MSDDIGECVLVGMDLIEACRDGRYWCECTHCGTRIDEEMTDLYEFDFEKDEVIERVLHPCCTIDGAVFCCRHCRGAEMQQRIAAAGRKQEQVRIAKKVFGADIQIVDVCGRARSGFCRCRDKFGHGVEYPGVDWEAPNKDGEFKNPIEWQGDENYRDCLLKIFFMGQRKGIYRWVTIDVCRNDEPAVREWLKTRWNHLLKLWEPFSESSD